MFTLDNDAVEHEYLQKLVQSIFSVHEDEHIVDCEGCGCQLDAIVELVANGADLHILLPAVEAHLLCCSDCREEFEALVAITRAHQNGALNESEIPAS